MASVRTNRLGRPGRGITSSAVGLLLTVALAVMLATSTNVFERGTSEVSAGIGELRDVRPYGIAAQLAPAPSRVVLPGLIAQGPPLQALVSTGTVFQGGATLVTVPGGVEGSATLFGREYPLAPSADGKSLVGLVGIGVLDPPGDTNIFVNATNALGMATMIERPLTIRKTEWTVWYAPETPPVNTPTPDPNAPEPPPPPPNETDLLPQVYAGITPRQWEDGWVAPLDEMRVTGYFGEMRSFNGGPPQGHHGGTDFGGITGTPIYATNSGTVVMAGHYLIRGKLVVIDHGMGIFSLYGHMSEIQVEVGDTVAKGQTIGLIGNTGFSTGSHLHWEMSVLNMRVDGLRWLDGSQGF